MALQAQTEGHRAQDILRVVLIIAAALAVLLVATVIFPLQGSGPSLEITADPAGVLPF